MTFLGCLMIYKGEFAAGAAQSSSARANGFSHLDDVGSVTRPCVSQRTRGTREEAHVLARGGTAQAPCASSCEEGTSDLPSSSSGVASSSTCMLSVEDFFLTTMEAGWRPAVAPRNCTR